MEIRIYVMEKSGKCQGILVNSKYMNPVLSRELHYKPVTGINKNSSWKFKNKHTI